MPTVKVGDINIYYEIHGQGKPLVLIMGIGYSCASWYPVIPTLSQKYQVVIFDNRGAGQSDKPVRLLLAGKLSNGKLTLQLRGLSKVKSCCAE